MVCDTRACRRKLDQHHFSARHLAVAVVVVITLLVPCVSRVRAETIAIGTTVEVYGTGGDGLNVRLAADTTATVLGVESDGARGTVQDGPVSAGGFTWWSVTWASGIAGWSVENYLRTPLPPTTPGSPTGVQAVSSVESVILTWDAPVEPGATPIAAWRIYRDRRALPTTLVATLTAGDPSFDSRSWTDGPMLLGGRTYWYRVSAVNQGGESLPSQDVSATPRSATLPPGLFLIPPQLDFGGELTSLTLTLQNTGDVPLSFVIAPGASWLTGAAPLAGSIPVTGSQGITLQVDRTALVSGAYESLLRITSGTQGFNVPVALRVGRIQGIDVSRWQCGGNHAGDPINWAAVRSAGCQFVFVKATEGITITDPFLHTLMPAARQAGLLAGAYHICWPGENDAAAEAAYFLQTAGRYVTSGFLVPVLDIEPRYNIGGTAMVTWIDEWAGAVRAATGVTPLIYCSTSVASNLRRADPTIDGRYRLWIAAYKAAAEPDTGGWNGWAFWQYSDSGTVPGIEGHRVDLDWFNGNEQSLRQYVIGGGTPPTGLLLTGVMGNGLISVNPLQERYPVGSTITVTANPITGWRFTAWGGNAEGTANPLVLTVNGDTSVLAIFERQKPQEHSITLRVGSDEATIDGVVLKLDAVPVIVQSRTLVPLRAIIEGLGGTITWTAETRGVSVSLGTTILSLQIGNPSAVVNGEVVTMDVPAAIMNGRTMLPVRFVTEQLGAAVVWEATTQTITITYPIL
jgi:lysozyme